MSDSSDLGHQILDLRLSEDNEAGVSTVREYLVALLDAMWGDPEFSGKRPFGNSGWKSDFEVALIEAGLVDGSFDEDGYIESLDSEAADRLIRATIRALGT